MKKEYMITHRGKELHEELCGLEKHLNLKSTKQEILTMREFNLFSFPLDILAKRLFHGEKISGVVSVYQNRVENIWEIAIQYNDKSTEVSKGEYINSNRLLNDLGYRFSS